MKRKLSIIALLLVCTILLSACSQQGSLYAGSFWLKNTSNFNIGEINESLEYRVSFTQSEDTSVPKFTVNSDASSYKTHLSDTTYNDERCYLFETELRVEGEFDLDGTKTPVNDSITTKAYFRGLGTSLQPIYSERTVDANSITLKNSKYAIVQLDYSIKTTYSDSAKVEFSCSDDCKEYFKIENGETVYEKYNESAYIDNEMAIFAPRAMQLSSAFSEEFTTIDAVAKVLRKITIAVDTAEPTKTLLFENTPSTNYFRNDEIVDSVITNVVNINLSENSLSSSTKAYYAAAQNKVTDDKNERHCLVMLIKNAPYNMGEFVYQIKLASVSEG